MPGRLLGDIIGRPPTLPSSRSLPYVGAAVRESDGVVARGDDYANIFLRNAKAQRRTVRDADRILPCENRSSVGTVFSVI